MVRRYRVALLCLFLGGCSCGAPIEADGGAWSDARATYLDSGAYVSRDAGSVSTEPCRGTSRRLRFDDLPYEQIQRVAGYGDRLAVHERDLAGTSRLRILDVVAGAEVGVTAPAPTDFQDVVVAHGGGFDLVTWRDADAAAVQFNRDGVYLGTAHYDRAAAPASPISNVIRTDAGTIALLGGTAPLSLEVLGSDGSVRTIPIGLAGEAVATISADDRWVAAAIAMGSGRGDARFFRLEVDLESESVSVVEMGSGPASRGFSRDLVAAHVGDGTALAAFALAAEVGQPSGLRLVWWSPGGAEVARRDVEWLSVDSIGLAGVAGPMPRQTLAYFTGASSSVSGRGYLVAARVRAPEVLEGGMAPLVSGIDVRYANTWEWIENGIAIAYSGSGRLEVLLTCVGAP